MTRVVEEKVKHVVILPRVYIVMSREEEFITLQKLPPYLLTLKAGFLKNFATHSLLYISVRSKA